eukprot:gb/GEZN01009636.1/.p1 GENE.gb/GEZN01009636.1/~~gb/GEZN01009636.1/.p1  ORF type:complete len:390 (-),score=65.71 gb/GEZN01009636.1/:117-1286(-)
MSKAIVLLKEELRKQGQKFAPAKAEPGSNALPPELQGTYMPGQKAQEEQVKAKRPEDAIPDKPGNEEARDFLKNAPSKGLWLPFGKEVKVMQCWRCKQYGHRTNDRECPLQTQGNIKNEAQRHAREDPMAALLYKKQKSAEVQGRRSQGSPASTGAPHSPSSPHSPSETSQSNSTTSGSKTEDTLARILLLKQLLDKTKKKSKKKKKNKSSKKKIKSQKKKTKKKGEEHSGSSDTDDDSRSDEDEDQDRGNSHGRKSVQSIQTTVPSSSRRASSASTEKEGRREQCHRSDAREKDGGRVKKRSRSGSNSGSGSDRRRQRRRSSSRRRSDEDRGHGRTGRSTDSKRQSEESARKSGRRDSRSWSRSRSRHGRSRDRSREKRRRTDTNRER